SKKRRVGKEGRSRWTPYHLKKKERHASIDFAYYGAALDDTPGLYLADVNGTSAETDLLVTEAIISSRRRHTRFKCDWSSDGVLFRSQWHQRGQKHHGHVLRLGRLHVPRAHHR